MTPISPTDTTATAASPRIRWVDEHGEQLTAVQFIASRRDMPPSAIPPLWRRRSLKKRSGIPCFDPRVPVEVLTPAAVFKNRTLAHLNGAVRFLELYDDNIRSINSGSSYGHDARTPALFSALADARAMISDLTTELIMATDRVVQREETFFALLVERRKTREVEQVERDRACEAAPVAPANPAATTEATRDAAAERQLAIAQEPTRVALPVLCDSCFSSCVIS